MIAFFPKVRIFTKGDEDLKYNGYFLMAEGVDYTVSEGELDAELNLTAPVLSGGDKLVHFDVSGFTSGHAYELYQDHVKRLVVLGVDIDGEVITAVSETGSASGELKNLLQSSLMPIHTSISERSDRRRNSSTWEETGTSMEGTYYF